MIAGSLVYDDSIDTSEIHQVLFIDSNVSEFKDYANTSTFPIIYDRSCTRGQMSEVLSIKFSSISRIAFVSHFSETPYFLTGCRGCNGTTATCGVVADPEYSTKVPYSDVLSNDAPINELLFSEANTQFVVDVIKQFQVSNIDYLACNTLASSTWTDYYSTISGSTGVTIGASDNNTGNIKYGGDWILESTHEDVHVVYFNDLVQNYALLLAVIQYLYLGTNLNYNTYSSVGQYASVTGWISGTAVNVPRTIVSNTYEVTDIASSAFQGTPITSFTTSGTISLMTSIYDYAFSGCQYLNSVTIPPSVTFIGENVFSGCMSLTTISITGTNFSFGNGALYNYSYSKLKQYLSAITSTSYTVTPSSVTTIGNYAFNGCQYLNSVTIPANVTTIGDNVFFNCTNLVTINLTSGLNTIGTYMLSSTKVTSISIPSSVTSIAPTALSQNTITTITVDAGNTTYSSVNGILFNKLQTSIIQYPTGLTATSYIIPPNITTINASAFYNCKNLTSIILPTGLKYISNDAFSYCTNLTSINIPNGVTYIGNSAFSNCTSLISINIPNSVTYIGDSAFYYCTSLISVNIPTSITTISTYAFYNCTSLKFITIPSNITTISMFAFNMCTSLIKVLFMATTIPAIYYGSFENVTLDTAYYYYGAIDNGPTYYTPKALRDLFNATSSSIGQYIYASNGIVYIYIYAGSTAVVDSYDSTLPASVTIPSTITTNGKTYSVISISDDAFKNCISIISVVIPLSVTSIGNYAFNGCSSLKKVFFIGRAIPSIGSNNFTATEDTAYYVNGATNTAILTNAPAMFSYTSYINDGDNYTDINVYFYNGVVYGYSGSSAIVFFYGSTLPGSVTIPSTITAGGSIYSVISIDANAFSSNYYLNAVTIPSSVTTIGASAFQDCTTLSSVIFLTNNVLTSIGISAFSGCIALNAINFTNITTPAGWSIGNAAFNCINLKHVVFGSKLPTDSTITSTTTFTSANDIAYKPITTTLTSVSNPNLFNNFTNIKDISNITAPTITSVVSTSYGNAIVNFTPGNIPQPPITNYKYSLDGSNSNTWTLCSPAITTTTITSTSFTISGLSSGTTYSVSMKATNFIGDGPASIDSVFTTTSSTTGPFSTIGTNSILGINNIPNLSVNTNCLAFHAPMGVYFTNPNLYAPTSQYFNFNSQKGFNFNSGNTKLVTIDNVGSLWSNGLYVTGGGVSGGGNIICESNMIVLGKVISSKLQLSNSSTIVSIRRINFLVGAVGASSTGLISKTYTYGVTYKDSTKLFFKITPLLNYGSQVSDTFSATIVSVTTSSMTFNVQRTDSKTAWVNPNLSVDVIITEIA